MNRKTVALFAVFLAGLLFLGSCATAPQRVLRPPDAAGIEYLPLDPGALAYMYTDVEAARPILNRVGLGGVSGRQVEDILDRTQYAAAAVYPPASGQNAQVVAWGKYPSAGAGFYFAFSKDWKKRKSAAGKSYWYSERNGLSVALNSRQAFVALGANLDPFAASPGTPSPEGFSEFRRGAALSLWLDNPAVPLNRFLSEAGLPLQIPAEQLLISLHPAAPDAEFAAEAGYEAHLRIKTPSPSQARALVTIFSMARRVSGAAGTGGEIATLLPILFANPPVQDGAFLNIRTAPMEAGEIALLFGLFSVYSTQN
ncbi:hypothetical protein AGMMS49587_20350 [Spirochaetia bacterium]|nr:hypothetical protein AGMMS49587_20350 [Spirochaetia bacterium]